MSKRETLFNFLEEEFPTEDRLYEEFY